MNSITISAHRTYRRRPARSSSASGSVSPLHQRLRQRRQVALALERTTLSITLKSAGAWELPAQRGDIPATERHVTAPPTLFDQMRQRHGGRRLTLRGDRDADDVRLLAHDVGRNPGGRCPGTCYAARRTDWSRLRLLSTGAGGV